MGPAIGQTALMYGANDLGSVMLEENVVSAAGTTWCLDEAKLCLMIREAGFTPAKRDNAYNILTIHTGDDAPDRRVDDWSILNNAKLITHTEETENVTLTISK